MKKIIFLLIFIVLISSVSAYTPCYVAAENQSTNASDYLIYDKGGDSVNLSYWVNNGMTVSAQDGYMNLTGNTVTNNVFGTDIEGLIGGQLPSSNISIEITYKVQDPQADGNYLAAVPTFMKTGCHGSTNMTGCQWAGSGVGLYRDEDNGQLRHEQWQAGCGQFQFGDYVDLDVWNNYTWYINTSTRMSVINSTGDKMNDFNAGCGSGNDPFDGRFGFATYQPNDILLIDSVFVYNGTECPLIPSDAAPPPTGDLNISVVNQDPPNSSSLIISDIVFKFVVNDTANCSLFIDGTLEENISASSGSNSFTSLSLANNDYYWNVNCVKSSISVDSIAWNLSISNQQLSMTECPDSVANSLILLLVLFASIIFIFIGVAMNVGVIGFFGSLMLMVSSWYVAPCLSIFSYILALFSMVLLIFFAVRGLSGNNANFN